MASRNSSLRQHSSRARRNGSVHDSKTSSIIEVRDSIVHGCGVFATQPIVKGTRIIEYSGKRMPWSDVPDDDDPHTFLFDIEDGHVINAGIGGNDARWINHSCDPNCEAVGKNGGIFIYALRDIASGEELSYDYSLELAEPFTHELIADYKCHCRTPNCRGTMLDIKKR